MSNAAQFALGRLLVPLLLIVTLVFPYVGGAGWAYLLIVSTLIATLLHLLLFRQLSIDAAGVLFLVAFLLILAVYVITSRPGTTDWLFAFNFTMFVLFVPLQAIFRRHARPGNVLLVANLALAGAVLAATVALVQIGVLGYHRAEGYGSNPIPSSTTALLLGFLALMGFLAASGPRRYLYLLGPVLGIVVVLLAGSRGPLLGAAALLTLSLLMIPKNRWLGGAALAAVVAIAVAGLLLVPEYFGRVSRLVPMLEELLSGRPISESSGSIRFQIFEGSLRAFADSPWIGHGWGAKNAVVDSYLAEPVLVSPSYHLHSDILTFAVTGGIVGLIAYLLVLLAPLLGAFRSERDGQFGARAYGAAALVVGYAACGTVNLLFGFEYLTTFYILLAAILLGFCRDQPVSEAAR
ncbi:MAG TPA: O-antigen ligase family protein [Devosiaceae bacterium]|jgi:O-antigen ligase|nr:O-antigen ligase family protein [Devosiaceae bacterium]